MVNSPEQSQAQTQAAPSFEGTGENKEAVQAQAAPAAYTPSLKFKVHGKEQEFDKFLHGVVKDAETEKKVRELYEKAYGLDHVKPKYQEAQGRIQQMEKQFAPLVQVAQELNSALKKGDIDTVIEKLGLRDEDIYKWVHTRLQEKQLPPDQQAALAQSRQLQRQQEMLNSQVQEQQSLYEQQMVASRERELTMALSIPEYASVAATYDAQFGQGAFRNEIISRGVVANQMGQDPSPLELVQQVSGVFGKLLSPGQANAQAQVTQNAQTETQTVVRKTPTLPNISGNGTTAAKKPMRSIDDIKARAAQFE